ncbi:hypothetical protein [Prosthecodimorpha staleyi]|uniref:Uncharacterized protein n=1 Tax=Prosthecodimorpha staleyi TaxID=2840188 RepID=A0A947GK80_9HYPH|nr:hypothetical protein [Prosthecodimorpha staleyi]MBT9293329.1 hypothetical protein [Prosthecodimorpha staleyi]
MRSFILGTAFLVLIQDNSYAVTEFRGLVLGASKQQTEQTLESLGYRRSSGSIIEYTYQKGGGEFIFAFYEKNTLIKLWLDPNFFDLSRMSAQEVSRHMFSHYRIQYQCEQWTQKGERMVSGTTRTHYIPINIPAIDCVGQNSDARILVREIQGQDVIVIIERSRIGNF